MFPNYIEDLVKEMAEESTSIRTMNPHPRIDVVKFNGTNNFGMWRCEMMDALTASISKTLYDWRRSETQPLKKIGIR